MAEGSGSAGGHAIRLANGSSIELRVFPDEPRLLLDVQDVVTAHVAEADGDPDQLRSTLQGALRAWYPRLEVHERTEFASLVPSDQVWYVIRDGRVRAPDRRTDRLHAALATARDRTAEADAALARSQRVIAGATTRRQRGMSATPTLERDPATPADDAEDLGGE